MPTIEVVAIVSGCVSVLAAGVSGYFAASGTPSRLVRLADEAAERARTAERATREVLDREAERSAAQAAFLEQAEAVLASVETRRRRIAAAEARKANGEDRESPEPEALNDPIRLRQIARSRGLI